ncbi:MAG: hypothetical protein Kow0031_33080 [Anaerolineae bacterium]
MKRGILLFIGLFALTLAVVFGLRASADAIAVIIGVVLGVVASVPTTVLLTYALLRSRNQPEAVTPPYQPPVVVINAGDRQPTGSAPMTLPAPLAGPSPRQWTVIGDVDSDD